MKTRSMYKAERMSFGLDRISTLPDSILETILCLLDTREAGRTSILSREWRYKWTKIRKLELDHYISLCDSVPEESSPIASTGRNVNMKCEACRDIQQILRLHQGPLFELTFLLPEDEFLELDRIILHLSKNHPVQKLKLIGCDYFPCKLPMSVFSFHQLTDLSLYEIDLHNPPIFDGFGSLRSLSLTNVDISTTTLLHLLSNCPSLKSLSLVIRETDDECTVSELFECLPKIEYLTMTMTYEGDCFQWLVLDSVSQELPTLLIHLKYFRFQDVYLGVADALVFLLLLIKCSPNLEKLYIESVVGILYARANVKWEEIWGKYSDVWLEHLTELDIGCYENRKHDMDLVKFILARSPKLKKVTVYSRVATDPESKVLESLLQAPRVSQEAVIDVKRSGFPASPSTSTG